MAFRHCFVVCLLLIPCAYSVGADDALWPHFLAKPSNEVKAADLPLEWSPEKGITWKVEIPGYGQSSPVVWGDHIYTTAISGPKKEKCLVSAFDLTNGKLLWTKESTTGMTEENTIYVSRAAASPVADADGVIAFFEGGIAVAYTHDGSERWKRNLAEEFGPTKVRHGLASSIAQLNDAVFIWVEREKEPYVLALSTKDGKELWKVPGLGKTAWSSPSIMEVAGEKHLALSAQTMVVGLNPKTGERLWALEGLVGNTTPSPRPLPEGKLLLGASARGDQGGTGNAAQSNALVQIKKGNDGKFAAEFVWKAQKANCSFNSPLAHDGFAYYITGQGVMYCLDLATGEQKYGERFGESAWATPIAVEDRIYCFGKGGSFAVLKAGPSFEVLAQGRTWPEGEVDSSPDKGSTELPSGMGGGGPGGGGGARPGAGGQGGGGQQGRGGGGGGAGGPMGGSATQYAAVIVPGKILIRRGGALYCISK